MSGKVLRSRSRRAAGGWRTRWALLALLTSLTMGQLGCSLIGETIYLRVFFDNYVCRATLVDTAYGERRVVDSSMLASTAPGAPDRSFIAKDWDGNGRREDADALLDWRRYLAAHVLTSRNFIGRSWCARPSDISCVRRGTVGFNTTAGSSVTAGPPALPAGAPAECPADAGGRLEVSAPGLAPDGQFSFPDTAVGDVSAPVTFTVTNPSTVPLRVNGVALLPGAHVPDFVKSADTCQPTSMDIASMRGYFLGAGRSCTFQMQFRPQHRDGVPECADAAPDESCRRSATLSVTGESNLERNALTPANVGLSGRALGGRLTVEPSGEVCFSASVPVTGWCTERRTIRLRNDGLGELTVSSAGIMGGSGAGGFQQLAPFPALPLRLAPGGTADFTVRFCNEGSAADSTFTINSSDHRSPTTTVTLVNPLGRRCP